MNKHPAKLFCKTGTLAGTEIDVHGDISIGRQPTCDLVLYPHTISGKHARIYFSVDDGAYYIEDLGSSNGTWVDRVRVEKPFKLDSLNVITFAKDIDFVFHIPSQTMSTPASSKTASSRRKTTPPVGETSHTQYQSSFESTPSFSPEETKSDGPDASEKQKTVYQSSFSPPPDLDREKEASSAKTIYDKSFEEPPTSLSADRPKPKKRLYLTITTKEDTHRYVLKKGKNTIGRSSTCDITIQDPFISSNHANLYVKPDGITLEDLQSSNKTYVDGEPISRPVKLKPTTTFRFGPHSDAQISTG